MARRRVNAHTWRDFRGVARPLGAVMVGVGVAILFTAGVAGVWDWLAPAPHLPQGGYFACAGAAGTSIGMGALLFFYGRRYASENMTRREALLAVTLIWFGAGVCGALPFVYGARMGFFDALFEAVSGFTTTGATVITDIEDRLSRPLLLWRSMTQWLGGMGIVVLFVAVFPNLGAGGKHLYRGEAPGAQAEGFKPRIAETSMTLWKLYAAFTIIEMVLLAAFGMDLFEALCHALTTMSTGGFSTRDASVGGFGVPAFEWIIAIFMLIGSVNYGLYYLLLRGRDFGVLVRNIEFRTYVALVLLSTALLALLNLDLHEYDFIASTRTALFMVATTVSSTGYGTDDYTAYGMPAFTIMLLIMFVGGCSGSTAGGIKIERVVMLAKQTYAQVKRSFDPAVVQVVRMGRAVVSKPVLADVAVFFVVYMVSLGVGVLVVATIEAVPAQTAFGAMLTCLSNMGPAPFHDAAGFSDNFAAYTGVSKVFFVVAMLLGRLEFFTMFALLVPEFWRR